MILTLTVAVAATLTFTGTPVQAPDTGSSSPGVHTAAPRPGFAQSASGETEEKKDSSSASRTSGRKKVIRLDALTVEGRIQKPQAFYILQRSNLNFEELNRTETFVPKVEESVEGEPF